MEETEVPEEEDIYAKTYVPAMGFTLNDVAIMLGAMSFTSLSIAVMTSSMEGDTKGVAKMKGLQQASITAFLSQFGPDEIDEVTKKLEMLAVAGVTHVDVKEGAELQAIFDETWKENNE